MAKRSFLAAMLISTMSPFLAAARAQTRAFGSIAELRKFIMDAVKATPGVTRVKADAVDPGKFSFSVRDVSSTSDVQNLFSYIRAYPEQADAAIAHFINAGVQANERMVEDASIVAVIRNRDYVNMLAANGVAILHEPISADLVIVYMHDTPDAMSPITQNDVPGKDVSALREVAMLNVRQWLPKIASDDALELGTLYYVEDNTMLSTSLILLDEFWASIAKRFPGDVLIALPRKDQLFVFDDSPSGQAMARWLIRNTFEGGFNLLSPHLYARRGGKIVQVAE